MNLEQGILNIEGRETLSRNSIFLVNYSNKERVPTFASTRRIHHY